MLNNEDLAYNFADSDSRQAMHSKDAHAKDAAQRSSPEPKKPGTAMIPIGPVFDASCKTTQSVIREHKFSTIFLAGLMGFAIGAALGR
jgi:hypothetical protein